MNNFKVAVYKDLGKAVKRFDGICIAISGIYCYCVEVGSSDIVKVSFDRVRYIWDDVKAKK
ncbi:MAG: hypothetical protein PF569_09355 [Candidatus Woesearchaeota archaeon]|jgi:hypothetical protein|nr:hypothetical protein [Candidatus Woesearchaeota archaeon]